MDDNPVSSKAEKILHHRATLQGGAPPVLSWFITPIKYRYINHKPKLLELLTNLANELGHHQTCLLKHAAVHNVLVSAACRFHQRRSTTFPGDGWRMIILIQWIDQWMDHL